MEQFNNCIRISLNDCTLQLLQEIYNNIQYICFSVYNNSQKNTKLKFQREGYSSFFVIVTAIILIKPWYSKWITISLLLSSYIVLIYSNQTILSLYRISLFETFINNVITILRSMINSL